MANSSSGRKGVRIGRDGRIYMDGTGGGSDSSSTQSSMPASSKGGGRAKWVVLLLAAAVLFFWLQSLDNVSVLNGRWRTLGQSGSIIHEIDDGVDRVYYADQIGGEPLATDQVSSLGRFDASDFGSVGKGDAFKIGNQTYLLFDSNKDTLVCCNLDGSGYSGTSSLVRIDAR